MKKEFAPYDRSLKIKALGFDEPCFAWYVSESYGLEYGKVVKSDLIKDGIVAPTFSQAFRWFREEHNLFGKIEVLNFGADEYCFEIYDLFEEKTIYDNFQGAAASYTGTFNTYEEAELACLDKLIEIVELKQQEQ